MKRITLITLVVAAAVMPTFAQARPMESASNDRAHHADVQTYYADPQYWVGPGEIPYLTQDVGSGVSPDDRPFSRATPIGEPATVVVTKDSGWSIDLGNPAFAGLALMLGLLAGGMGVALYNHRRTKLSPA
jgi:hypothetical protein